MIRPPPISTLTDPPITSTTLCRSPYVFTASLPPSVVATAATSIRKRMHGSNKRAHLWENSKTLHKGLRDLGFTLGTEEPQSAIIAVIMPDLEKGATMWEARSEERRVGKECVSTCRSRWSPYH